MLNEYVELVIVRFRTITIMYDFGHKVNNNCQNLFLIP